MNAKKIPVILDTDIGGDIDDTWALAMMLKRPELDVKLICSDTANTEYRSGLIAKLLEVAGRTDIPVGVGLKQEPRPQNQAAWLNGYDLTAYPGVVYYDGVQAIIDTIMNAPEPITLICIGPVPNIAEALRRTPEIAGRAHFVGMHGSIRKQHHGKPGAIAEWNVVADAKSCREVFAAPWLSRTITPLDTCGVVQLTGGHYRRAANCDEKLQQAVIENYHVWIKNVNWFQGDVLTQSSILFDTVAIHLACSQDFLEMRPMKIAVTDDGMTVEDPNGVEMNVAIAWKDLNGYYDHLVDTLEQDVVR